MAHRNRESKELKMLNRYFTIAKVFLAVTPFICYLYISLQGIMMNKSFQEVLTHNPHLTIIFLIAMINPYIAYLVQLIQKNLKKQKTSFVCMNMVLLLVAELVTMNVFYFIMLIFVFYRAIQYYNIPVISTLKNSTIKQTLFDGGGSLLVMLISCISLFATIKLM